MIHCHPSFCAATALLVAVIAWPAASQAAPIVVTLSGTVSSGFDAYRNSVYFGSDAGYNLTGMQASISVVYDSTRFVNVPGNAPNWSSYHSPNYPDFLGTSGMGPIISSSFTINGITTALDVSGLWENASLQVSNPVNTAANGARDSYGLMAGDDRAGWCLADRQCVEKAEISATSYFGQDLFGGQHAFSPDEEFSLNNGGAVTDPFLEGSVRMIQNPLCLSGGQYAGLCPEGRYTDGQTHWVEFLLRGTSLTVTRQPSGTGSVPEPSSLALVLAAGGLGFVVTRRRAG